MEKVMIRLRMGSHDAHYGATWLMVPKCFNFLVT